MAPAEGVRTSDTGGRVLEAAGRIAWIAAALSAVVLLWSLSRHQPGWAMTIVVWGLAVLSAARPFDGLLVLAGFGPVVTTFSVIVGANERGLHYPEALALAFIAGAAAHRAFQREPFAVPGRVAWPALMLIAAALASALIDAAVLGVEQPALRGWAGLPLGLVQDYLLLQNQVSTAALFAEGLVLFLLVADLCGRVPAYREPLLRMMIAGAAGDASLNIVRLVLAAMRQEHAWTTFLNYLATARVSSQYPDWNAAGSHFAMMLIIAAVYVARRRLAYLIPVLVIAVALWVTGSRTAMLAAILAAGLVVLSLTRSRRQRVVMLAAAGAVVLAAAVAGWLWYPSDRNDPIAFSVRTRLVLWRAGVSMMTTNPMFGVGLGGFYERSHDYAPEMLDTVIWRPHENAHNYFIQVLAELGMPGLILFIAILAGSLREAWKDVRRNAWTMGIVAFLLTALTGHPFLIPQVAYAFWMTLAVAAVSSSGPAASRLTRPWLRLAGCVVILILVVSLPARTRAAVRHADLGRTAVGLTGWQQDAEGVRYRWATAQSTFFYSSGGRAVRIPIRPGPDAPSEMDVRIFFDGQEANRVRLRSGDEWRYVRLVRSRKAGDADYFRIDLTAATVDGSGPLGSQRPRILMVGTPSILWGE